MKRLLVFLCILAASLSTLVANPYSGNVSLVVIDAGHGGGDPGAMANSLVEKDLTLSISLALEQELEKRGVGTLMTREDDTFLELQERLHLDTHQFRFQSVRLRIRGLYQKGGQAYRHAL